MDSSDFRIDMKEKLDCHMAKLKALTSLLGKSSQEGLDAEESFGVALLLDDWIGAQEVLIEEAVDEICRVSGKEGGAN
jgi:hypothetical protein